MKVGGRLAASPGESEPARGQAARPRRAKIAAYFSARPHDLRGWRHGGVSHTPREYSNPPLPAAMEWKSQLLAGTANPADNAVPSTTARLKAFSAIVRNGGRHGGSSAAGHLDVTSGGSGPSTTISRTTPALGREAAMGNWLHGRRLAGWMSRARPGLWLPQPALRALENDGLVVVAKERVRRPGANRRRTESGLAERAELDRRADDVADRSCGR